MILRRPEFCRLAVLFSSLNLLSTTTNTDLDSRFSNQWPLATNEPRCPIHSSKPQMQSVKVRCAKLYYNHCRVTCQVCEMWRNPIYHLTHLKALCRQAYFQAAGCWNQHHSHSTDLQYWCHCSSSRNHCLRNQSCYPIFKKKMLNISCT